MIPHFLRTFLTRFLPYYLFYLLLALIITYPLISVFSTHFAGDFTGDAYEYARHIWWYAQAIPRGLSPFEQPLFAYPDGLPSWYLWGVPLRTFPAFVFAWMMPLPAAWNLTLLLRLALNGYAMFWVMRRWTGSVPAALLSGAAYLALPAAQGHLFGGHLDLLTLWGVPLYAWALGEAIQHKDTKAQRHEGGFLLHTPHSILLTFLTFIASLLGSFVLAVYVLTPITLVVLLRGVWARNWRGVAWALVGVMLGALGALIFVLPAALELLNSPLTAAGGSVRYSGDLLAVFTPSFLHPVWGRLDYTHRVLGVNLVEGSGYVGVIAGVLALIGFWRVREARWWGVVAALAWVFSLGPLLNVLGEPLTVNIAGEYQTFVPLPWALFQNLPILNVSRTPGRFLITVGLSVAVLAGYGAAWLFLALKDQQNGKATEGTAQRSPFIKQPAPLVAGILIVLILFDYQSFFPLPTIPAVVPPGIAALAGRADVRAVFTVPSGNLLAAKEALWLQTAHGLPLIAGQVTRATPVDPAKLAVLEATLDPALLREAGADVVIVQRGFDADGVLYARAMQQLGAPIWENERFAVFETPHSAAQAALTVWSDGAPIENTGFIYTYAPETGWLEVYTMAEDGGSPPRQPLIALDGVPISRPTGISTYIPLASAGYHTLRVDASPACPPVYDAALICPPLFALDDPASPTRFIPDAFDATVQFGRGVTLRGAQTFDAGSNSRTILLWWQFAEGVTEGDIRFVKILNAAGEQVAGIDQTLGVVAAGQHAETLFMPTPDLPAGVYTVYAGWYTYPDLVRFPILDGGGERAQDGLVYVGTFTIP